MRREVPLSIVPPSCAVEESLGDFVVVQRVLMMEERNVYQQALQELHTSVAAAGGGGTWGSALIQLHHASSYQQVRWSCMKGAALIDGCHLKRPSSSGVT